MAEDLFNEQPHWMQISQLAARWADETGEDPAVLDLEIVQWFASYLVESAPEELEASKVGKGTGPVVDSDRHLSQELCAEFCRDTNRPLPKFWFEPSGSRAGALFESETDVEPEKIATISPVEEVPGLFAKITGRIESMNERHPLLASRLVALALFLVVGGVFLTINWNGDSETGEIGAGEESDLGETAEASLSDASKIEVLEPEPDPEAATEETVASDESPVVRSDEAIQPAIEGPDDLAVTDDLASGLATEEGVPDAVETVETPSIENAETSTGDQVVEAIVTGEVTAPDSGTAQPEATGPAEIPEEAAVTVFLIRQQLAEVGFPTSSSKVTVDPDLRSSILAYQAKNGLPADGDATAALLAHMVNMQMSRKLEQASDETSVTEGMIDEASPEDVSLMSGSDEAARNPDGETVVAEIPQETSSSVPGLVDSQQDSVPDAQVLPQQDAEALEEPPFSADRETDSSPVVEPDLAAVPADLAEAGEESAPEPLTTGSAAIESALPENTSVAPGLEVEAREASVDVANAQSGEDTASEVEASTPVQVAEPTEPVASLSLLTDEANAAVSPSQQQEELDPPTNLSIFEEITSSAGPLLDGDVSNLLAKAALAPTSRNFVANGADIIELTQRRLKEAGFNPGPIDGRPGPRTRRAIAGYQRAYQLEVDGRASLELLDHLDTRALQLTAIAATNEGDYATAILAYSQIIRLRPGDGHAYFNRGLTFKDAGLFDRAIADYDTALRMDDSITQALYDRGNIYYRQGNYGQALEDYLGAAQNWWLGR